jgi:hypothetical protein
MHGKTYIDWEWVRQSLLKNEKVSDIRDAGKKMALLDCAERCVKMARQEAAPRVTAVKKGIEAVKDGSLILEGGVELSSKYICRYLSRAQALYLFAVTIGSGVEKAATSHMNNGDTLSGYLLDRVGSYACESLAESAEANLRGGCEARGMSVSMRLSPGYCDWPIEEQFKLDKIINLSAIDIELNENCMMIPKKSITAIAGIGPGGLFKEKKSQCGLCDKTDCYLRRDD